MTIGRQLPGFVAEGPDPFDQPAGVANGRTVDEAVTALNLAYYPDPPTTDFSKPDNRYNISVYDGLSADAMASRLGATGDSSTQTKGELRIYTVGKVKPDNPDGPTWTTVVFSPHNGTVIQINGRGLSEGQLVAVADGISQ